MNVKLKRVIEEIEKTEKKISEWQEQLKQLRQQRKQLEDQEIIKSIRSMQMNGADMLELLDGIQSNGEIAEDTKQRVLSLLHRSFRPEFLNRLDEIVFYKPLTKDNIQRIIDLQIDKLNSRLEAQQITCRLTDSAKRFIVDEAYDPEFGARPLRRYVQHTVETMLSRKILEGTVPVGSTVTVDCRDGELILE